MDGSQHKTPIENFRRQRKRFKERKAKKKEETRAALKILKLEAKRRKNRRQQKKRRGMRRGGRNKKKLTAFEKLVLKHKDEGLEEGDAGEKGRGVFANRNFSVGEFLCEYRGVLLSKEDGLANLRTP